MSSRDRSGVSAWIGFALALLAPVSAFLVQMAISREREFLADARSAQWMGKADNMIAALEKIRRDQIPLPVNYAVAPAFIASPFKGKGLDAWLSTHPSIDERIARLRQLTFEADEK